MTRRDERKEADPLEREQRTQESLHNEDTSWMKCERGGRRKNIRGLRKMEEDRRKNEGKMGRMDRVLSMFGEKRFDNSETREFREAEQRESNNNSMLAAKDCFTWVGQTVKVVTKDLSLVTCYMNSDWHWIRHCLNACSAASDC